MFGFQFRELLPMAVRDEFESLYARLQKFLFAQHGQNGVHTDITADSLEVSGDVTLGGDVAVTGDVTVEGDTTVEGDLDVTGDVSAANGIFSAALSAASALITAIVATTVTIATAGLKLFDTDGSHTLGIVVGSNLTADRTLTLTTGDANRSVGLGAWTSFVPAWMSTGTQPSIGDGSLTGAWIRIGNTVHFRILLTFGASTNPGTGVWIFGLPATSVSPAGSATQIGPCMAFDSSVGLWYTGSTRHLSTTTFTAIAGYGQPQIGLGQPFTWTNPDQLGVQGTYEAA